jgi:hypothetical protein
MSRRVGDLPALLAGDVDDADGADDAARMDDSGFSGLARARMFIADPTSHA